MARVGRDGAGLVLRLALGTVLIWAGFGKSCHTMPVQGEQAAVLANLGVISGPARATPAPTPAPPSEAAPPETDEPAATGDETVLGPDVGPAVIRVAAARPTPTREPAPPDAAEQVTDDRFSAADFPEPVEIRRWKGLVLLMHSSQVNDHGTRLVPAGIASNGSVMKMLAAGAAWTELLGGIALVLGAMTRLAAFMATGILGGAMWLTEIGPMLGSPDAMLGFLPDWHIDDPALATTAWSRFLLQLVTASAALALMLVGPGRLSADHFFWGEKPGSSDGIDDADEEDDD